MRPDPTLRRTNDAWRVAAPSQGFRYLAAAETDVGCVRTVNEDAVYLRIDSNAEDLQGVAAVCDGMGGHEAGEVASALATEIIAGHVRAAMDTHQQTWPFTLIEALEQANARIHAMSRADPQQRGMGSTCCALTLVDGSAWCAHVGDSRCYLLRHGDLLIMTEDHSAVMHMVRRGLLSAEEARAHPERNVISRALGTHASVQVSAWTHPFLLHPGDALLLCSDGLYDLVPHEEIATILGMHLSPAERCSALVANARARGGHDNISVVIIDVLASQPSTQDATDREPGA